MKKIFSLIITLLSMSCSSSVSLIDIKSLSDLDLCVESIQASNNSNRDILEEEILSRNLNCDKFGTEIEIAVLRKQQEETRSTIIKTGVAVLLLGLFIDAQEDNKYPLF